MSALTAALLGALLVYGGGWFLGHWTGNFSLLLFVLTVVTFGYWLGERYRFRPAREAAALALVEQDQARRRQLAQLGIAQVDGDVEEARRRVLAQPWWLDWTAGLFPVILIVFCVRSFLFEPFKIPSGSMMPTLLVGDLILVNKFEYGVRLPVINKKIVENKSPQRGDVVVFRYPVDTRVDYIKRVVGVPGDKVEYLNKQLQINGEPVATSALPDFYDDERLRYAQQFTEKLGNTEHRILVDRDRPGFIPGVASFPFSSACSYSAEGVRCTVPEGHYFVMGDNRDNSQDSRYWGFVPDANLVGRAFFVWLNFGNLGRIGSFH